MTTARGSESQGELINPEHLTGHDNTMYLALKLWSSRNGPVMYNRWQSVYWQLKRMGMVDQQIPESGEEPRDFQKRLKLLYGEIQEEIHGPDHLAEAVAKSLGTECRQSLSSLSPSS